MKISIVTVMYNARRTIADTIDSVRAQDHSNYEHIVVDGCSTDGSVEIIRKGRQDKLVLISEPDDGIYDAMNKGIRVATGDLIGFLNADDYFCRTDALTLINSGALNNPTASAVSASVAMVDACCPSRSIRSYGSAHFRRWMLKCGHMPPHPGFYVRRSAFSTVGSFASDFKIGGDFEWMLRFFYANQLLAAPLAEIVVAMRIGGVSTRGLESMRRINTEVLRSLQAHNLICSRLLVWSRYLAKIGQLVIASRHFPPPDNVRWVPQPTLSV